MALSFADITGCKNVWDEITRAQSHAHGADHDLTKGLMGASGIDEVDVNGDDARFQTHAGDNYMETTILGDESRGRGANQFFSLPPPEISSLGAIAQLVNENAALNNAREKILAEISGDGKYAYLDALLDTFRRCEDLEDVDGLQQLYRIVRSLFLLADPDLLKNMLSEEKIIDVVGVLEYDPEYYWTSVGKGEVLLDRHREFLRNQVRYQDVIPIRDEAVLQQIHQNYRITYIRDVILPRSLDDGTFGALTHLIHKNNNDIVLHFLSDDAGTNALKELFERLKGSGEGQRAQRLKDLKLLLELCSLATKSLICSNRERFYRLLVELGLFDVCRIVLADEHADVQLLGAEIVSAILVQNQSLVRNHILSRNVADSLFSALIDKLSAETETGVILQVFEILRTLLDPDAISSDAEKSNFLSLFYDHYVQRLLKPLQESGTDKKNLRTLQSSICDFFSSCVAWHSYRAKYFVLGHNVVGKVLGLVNTESTFIAVSAVRFFRACVGRKDDFYNRYIVKNRLLGPIAKAFEENGNKDNLLNSAILELLDFMTRENVKILVSDLVENYQSAFEAAGGLGLLDETKRVYLENSKSEDKSRDASAHGTGTLGEGVSSRRGYSGRGSPQPAPDIDEDEAFFEADDNEDFSDDFIGPRSPSRDAAEDAEEGVGAPFLGRLDEEEEENVSAIFLAHGSHARPSADVTASSSDGLRAGCVGSIASKRMDQAATDSSNGPSTRPLVDYPTEDEDDTDETELDRQKLQMRLGIERGEVTSSAELANGERRVAVMADTSHPDADDTELNQTAKPTSGTPSEPQSKPKAQPVVVTETEAEPRAEPEAAASAEPEAAPQAEPKAEPKVEPNVDSEAEPKADSEAEPKADSEAEPKAEPQAVSQAESEPLPSVRSKPRNEARSEPEPGGGPTEPELGSPPDLKRRRTENAKVERGVEEPAR